MEILEYTSPSVPIVNVSSDEWHPLEGNIEKQISIQRLNHLYDRGTNKNYRILLILGGVETVAIEEEEFKPYTNLIAFIAPGKRLKLKTLEEPKGWVLCFSVGYMNLLRHENFNLFSLAIIPTENEVPKIVLSPKIGERIQLLAGMIDELAGSQIPKKENAINALLKTILVYCDSKCNVNLNINGNMHEVNLVSRFKQLVSDKFTQLHMVSDYAKIMGISPKYLNQLVKQIMRVTAKQVIQEQLIIKARRDLKFSNLSIKEIAFSLGFNDPSHFSSFFKELVGPSPSHYRDM